MQDEIAELRKQVELLTEQVQQHRLEIQALYESLVSSSRTVDDDAINRFVDEVLAESENNSAWIPDSIERAVYKKLTTVCVRALKQVLSTASVDVAGHSLKFALQPVSTGVAHENIDTLLTKLLSSVFGTARVQVAGHEVTFAFQ